LTIKRLEKDTDERMADTPVALDQLDRSKKGNGQRNVNARETIRFFDRAQSGRDEIDPDGIQMQAPNEQYPNWNDIERKFILPQHLEGLGLEGQVLTESKLAEELEKLGVKSLDGEADSFDSMDSAPKKPFDPVIARPKSIASPSTSTSDKSSNQRASGTNAPMDIKALEKRFSGGARPTSSGRQQAFGGSNGNRKSFTNTNSHKRVQSVSPLGVPHYLQPLFNCILYRMNEAESRSSQPVLVTNCLETITWAHKFGITVQRLDQLKASIALEDKDYKSRLVLFYKTREAVSARPGSSGGDDGDGEEVVYRSRAQANPKRGERGAERGSYTGYRPGMVQYEKGEKGRGRGESTVAPPDGPMDPNSFRRSAGGSVYQSPRSRRQAPEDEGFVLTSGAPRGAARGNGRLWEP
jgi:hypothetical protein